MTLLTGGHRSQTPGFETEIPPVPSVSYVMVKALEDNGQVLATRTPQA